MAYEYNPESSRFNLPNPHRVENVLLIVGGIAQLAAAAFALWIGRDDLVQHAGQIAMRPLAIGAALLVSGLLMIAMVMRQLVFYFGRNQPAPLADVLSPQKDGVTESGQSLRETIRQNAISFETPVSGFDQLLYKMIPDLVFSPPPVQWRARIQFYNAAVLLAIFLCFAVASFGVINAAAKSWIHLGFLILTAIVILKPLRARAGKLSLGIKPFVVLLLLSIVLPVLLSMTATRPLLYADRIHLGMLTTVFLVLALAANLLFLFALIGQTLRPDKISMANHLETLSMNAHPRQLLLELDRQLQATWTEKIPNRAYSRLSPLIEAGTGAFTGELLEESQPVPRDAAALSLSSALQMREYRYLVIVDLFAMIAALVGCGLLAYAASSKSLSAIDPLVLGAQLIAVSWYGFRTTNFLWRRFEFSSRAWWLEMSGNYQTSNVDYGRVLEDAVKTRKQVVNIDDMTLRIWVADFYSVAFGPDQPRFLVSMSGEQGEAERLCKHLREFAENQTALLAPGTARDVESAQRLAAMNAMGDRARSEAVSRNDIAAALLAARKNDEEPGPQG
jgi:hypothetical protein